MQIYAYVVPHNYSDVMLNALASFKLCCFLLSKYCHHPITPSSTIHLPITPSQHTTITPIPTHHHHTAHYNYLCYDHEKNPFYLSVVLSDSNFHCILWMKMVSVRWEGGERCGCKDGADKDGRMWLRNVGKLNHCVSRGTSALQSKVRPTGNGHHQRTSWSECCHTPS